MSDQDRSEQIQAQVIQAQDNNIPLKIVAGNSKSFYGRTASAETETLDISGHTGIVSYEPTELVITARAGTPLIEIEKALDKENQMLAFEPPHYGETATIGGTIACGLSGPRRAFTGAARDYLLGTTIINGKGEQIHFGGEVMKNVAGYDVSRLMCGAMGTLGVILSSSLKVLPKPETELTLVFEIQTAVAQNRVHQFGRKALPVSATCYYDDKLYVRLSGTEGAVKSAHELLGGEIFPDGEQFWQRLKEQSLSIFNRDNNIWRISLASNAPELSFPGRQIYEWNGALRWLVTHADEVTIHDAVAEQAGHAICLHQHAPVEQVFQPLSPALLDIHRKLKHAFDPDGILNPGRMYAGI